MRIFFSFIVAGAIVLGMFLIYIVAKIYGDLVGLGDEFFPISLAVTILGGFMLYVSYLIGNINHNLKHNPNQHISYKGGPCFWFIVLMFTAPIAINFLATLLKWLGYEITYSYLFHFRFLGMIFIPILCVPLYVFIRWLTFRYRRFRERLGVGIIERGFL